MAGASYNFFDTPEYQQKLAKLSREERKILGSFLVDDSEADKAMKQRLALMELGNREKIADRSLALQEKRISADESLGRQRLAMNERITRDQWEFERGQMPWATGIGIANVAAGGLSGWASMKRDEDTAEALRKLTGNYSLRW